MIFHFSGCAKRYLQLTLLILVPTPYYIVFVAVFLELVNLMCNYV
jgi:hypothetical protein